MRSEGSVTWLPSCFALILGLVACGGGPHSEAGDGGALARPDSGATLDAGGGDAGFVPAVLDGKVGVLTAQALAQMQIAPESLTFPSDAVVWVTNGGQTSSMSAAGLVPGTFLVSQGGEQAAFLRRVEGVVVTAGLATVSTSQASLTDLVQQGGFRTEIDADGKQLRPGVPQPRDKKPIGTGLNLSDKVFDLFQGKLRLVVNQGHLNFRPGLDLGATIGSGQLQEFHAIAKGNLDVQFDATATMTGALQLDQDKLTLFDESSYYLDFIGPVPVEETVEFSIALVCQLFDEGSFNLEGGFFASSDLQVGIRWSDNSGWSGVDSAAFGYQAIGPQLSGAQGAVELKCFLRPRLDLFFYSTLGPGLFVEPYDDLKIVTSPTPGSYDLSWGFDGAAAGSIKILGHTVEDLQEQLFNLNWPLASGPLPAGFLPTGGGSGAGAGSGSGSGAAAGAGSGASGGSGSGGGSNNPCAHTQYGGYYCGQSTQFGFSGGTPDDLYDCSSNQTVLSDVSCQWGCTVAPPGSNDSCNPEPMANPCANTSSGGLYCGTSTEGGFSGGSASWIYDCENHAIANKYFCPGGCFVAPYGQNDGCNGGCGTCPNNYSCQGGSCACSGTVCGERCCAAGDYCGTDNKCCDGTCTPGCPC